MICHEPFLFLQKLFLNYTVYILYSSLHNQIYIGFTSHLINRFKSHNELGNDWTSRFRPWIVIFCEFYVDKNVAMKREKQLKQYRQRLKIRQKINAVFKNKGYIDFGDG